MTPITIQQTLLDCGDARVVIAKDAGARRLMGLSVTRASRTGPVFVEIDRVTMLDLERGAIDVNTVLADRCAGIALTA